MYNTDPITTMRVNYSTPISEIPSIGTSPPSKLGITVALILVPLCVLALIVCIIAGICILLKQKLIQKQQREASIANEVNQPCYEMIAIDPIYEIVPCTESENLTLDNFGITTMNDDAYTKIHSPEKKCRHSPPLDFNASGNETYIPSEKVAMQNNSSYQAASPWQFMTAVTESEGPSKKRKCCDKQSIENIQQVELLCNSVKCVSPKHIFN